MKSTKFIPKIDGQTANSILIEGALTPLNSESAVQPLRINSNGDICTTSLISETTDLITTQSLTSSYDNLGNSINMQGYNILGIWIDETINDSENVTLKASGQLIENSSDLYEIDGISIKTLWTISGSDNKEYYEFDTGAIPYIQLQSKAEIVGSTPGELSIKYTKIHN